MAQAETDPTQSSPSWLSIIGDIIPRCDRLGSSENVKNALGALFDDPEVGLRVRRIDANGEEISGTCKLVGVEICRHLVVVRDLDSGDDHIEFDYSEPLVDYHTPGGHWELEVRRRDVERWEHSFPELAAPPAAPNEERAKPGPKPDFEWGKIETKCCDLMDHNGDFMPGDPDWDCQARLETALKNFCQETFGREPGDSTLREKLPGWLSAWRKRKTGKA